MACLRVTAAVIAAAVVCSGCEASQGGREANRVGDADGSLGPWVKRSHPCVGNRTDVMWFDDAEHGYVGCGSTTDGYGLFRTQDGGATWTDLVGSNFRVNSVQRGPDGALYVAGTGVGGNADRVLVLEGGSVATFYARPGTAEPWQTFQVGTFRVDGTGRAVAESLTGSDVLYWPDVSGEPVNGYGWWTAAGIPGGAQILDMEVHDGRYFAVGSTIAQPPYFFFEPEQGMGGAFSLRAIDLSGSTYNGEVWDIAIDANGDMLLAGVDQAVDVGMIWYPDGPPEDPASWVGVDIGPMVPVFDNNATRFYGACRDGDLMVAVGDFSQAKQALVVVSGDGGETWNFANPPGYGADIVGPLTRCQIVDGLVYTTGEQGFLGILDPSDF